MISVGAFAGLVSAGANLAAAILTKHDTSIVDPNIPDNSVAVYNTAYAKATQRRNAIENMHKGEKSITEARLKGVRDRIAIGLNQDEAEAQIRLNAAASGVTGDGVDTSIYQTHANAAYRISDQAIQEDNEIQAAINRVYSGSQGVKVMEDDYTVQTSTTGGGGSSFSLAGAIMSGISSTFNDQMLKDLGLALEDQDYNVDFSTDFGDRTSVSGGMGGV